MLVYVNQVFQKQISVKLNTIVKFFFFKKKREESDGIYLLKSNSRNTRTRYEICSKVTIKTPELNSAVFNNTNNVFVVNLLNVIAGRDISKVCMYPQPSFLNKPFCCCDVKKAGLVQIVRLQKTEILNVFCT